MQFEFHINDSGGVSLDPAAAAGRLVEELDIVGNRRMDKEEILSSIKTRPGDPYNLLRLEQTCRSCSRLGTSTN